MKRISIILGLVLACVVGSVQAEQNDLDYQRLSTALNQLANDPTLGPYAQAERSLAWESVRQLPQASRSERAHVLYIAERRVDLAKAAAQLDATQQQLNALNREHDRILLDASRREASATRRALDQARMQNQLAQEETQRLQAQGEQYSQAAEQARSEAEQARKLAQAQSRAASAARRQADLAEKAAIAMRQRLESMTAQHGAKGLQMTLEGDVFGSGQATMKPTARQHLGKLLQFVRSQPGKHIRIEGHTDSSGSSQANQSLSLQRARSVRDALVAAGINPSRISVAGEGEAGPVASNATASGRAQNRRVVVILQNN